MPTSPVISAATARSASSRASTAARCSPCDPNMRRSRWGRSSRAPAVFTPSPPTSAKRTSSRCGPKQLVRAADVSRASLDGAPGRTPRRRAQDCSGATPGRSRSARRRAPVGPHSARTARPASATSVRRRAKIATLIVASCAIPGVERIAGRAVAHPRQLDVALAQDGLQVAHCRLVGRVEAARERVEVGAPPRGAALDQKQALRHEDEDVALAPQVVERLRSRPRSMRTCLP